MFDCGKSFSIACFSWPEGKDPNGDVHLDWIAAKALIISDSYACYVKERREVRRKGRREMRSKEDRRISVRRG